MEKRYSIRFAESAVRSLKKLPASVRDRVAVKVEALANNPYPPGARRMTGEERAYRIRIGDYRVVYDVLEDAVVVMVLLPYEM